MTGRLPLLHIKTTDKATVVNWFRLWILCSGSMRSALPATAATTARGFQTAPCSSWADEHGDFHAFYFTKTHACTGWQGVCYRNTWRCKMHKWIKCIYLKFDSFRHLWYRSTTMRVDLGEGRTERNQSAPRTCSKNMWITLLHCISIRDAAGAENWTFCVVHEVKYLPEVWYMAKNFRRLRCRKNTI